MLFTNETQTPKTSGRKDGYHHKSRARISDGVCIVTTSVEVQEDKIAEVLSLLEGVTLWSNGKALDGAFAVDAVIITPKMAAKAFGKLAHHFPLHWREIENPVEPVTEETALIWSQFAQGVSYSKLEC